MTKGRRRVVATGGTAKGAAQSAGIDRLITLFTLRFRHNYYNAADGRCPDLSVVPTDSCAALMAGLGIIYRDQGDGFSVYIPQSRVAAMMDAIVKGYCADTAGRGCWTRLTFLMLLRNSDFVGITALPIDTSPMTDNLYASNLQTSAGAGCLLLGTNGIVGAADLHPVTNGSLALQSRWAGTVTAYDISGKPVASVDLSAGVPATLSFAGLPYDLYTISGTPRGVYTGPSSLAYVPASPRTSGVIDLLLTQPDAGVGDPAAFPVAMPPSPPPPGYVAPFAMPTTVNLVVQFEARETYWRYYVVSQSLRGGFADNLAISGEGTKFRKSIDTLPNGDLAVLFSATTSLPMEQRSSYRFSLAGQRRGANGSSDTISVDRLPVAPIAPVWPHKGGGALAGSSEIYVYV